MLICDYCTNPNGWVISISVSLTKMKHLLSAPVLSSLNRARFRLACICNKNPGKIHIRPHSFYRLSQSLEHKRRMSSASDDAKKSPVLKWWEEATLYVHWPYCQRRCTYCNFNKYISDSVDHDRMLDCLVKEATTLIELSGVKRIKSVFFGGGTPSLARPDTLHGVLQAVAGLLPADAEVTMEGNPTSVGIAKLYDFKQAGINRVSLGIQALNDLDLTVLGRDHSTIESIQCIHEARRLFPGHVSLDVIFGRPDQTLASWEEELRNILSICDDHLSLYELTLERGTALFKMKECGTLNLPDSDSTGDMYNTAVQMMEQEGLLRYEVSNFATTGSECQHNQSYWKGGQYIGIGPGAHGRFRPVLEALSRYPGLSGQVRNADVGFREARIQTLEPEPWMYEVSKYGHATRKCIRQSQFDVLQELLVVGLRTTSGVSDKRWMQFAGGPGLSEVFSEGDLRHFTEAGLIVHDDTGLRATMHGLPVLDSIIPSLLSILEKWQNNR